MSFNPHYKASPDTVGEGQRSTGTVTSDGRLRVEASAPTGSSSNTIQGAARDGAAVVGNPVWVAGTYETTLNTVEDGDASALKTDANGRLLIAGYGFCVTDAPTVTNGAYSAADVIGGYRTVTLAQTNDQPLMITGVQVTCKANVTPNIRVILFGATPAATLADNAAFTLSVADSLTVRKTLSSLVLGATWFSLGTPKSIYLADRPFVMNPISGGKTIGYYVIDDTGVTLTSTSDMQVTFFGMGV